MATDLAAVKAGDIWSEADYDRVYDTRYELLKAYREDPENLKDAKQYYKTHPAEFISDWMDTYDPRRLAKGDDTSIPFLLFERQLELLEFMRICFQSPASGLVDKSRDTGCTWISVGISVWLFCFYPGAAVGFGSLKSEQVDSLGDMKSILEKVRFAFKSLPPEFLPEGFNLAKDMPHMKITNSVTNVKISGESGDNIGRGDRTLVYFVDEAAWLERPSLSDASLSHTTRCRIDISTTSGIGHPYQRKLQGGRIWEPGDELSKVQTNVFIFDWKHHPAKTQDWYDQGREKSENDGQLHTWAQEVDRDPTAALLGTIIKKEWVEAAIDLHLEVPELEDGGYMGGLDLASGVTGGDQHAFCWRKGLVLKYMKEWGHGDAGKAARTSIGMINGSTPIDVMYDAVGVGEGAKSEYNRLEEEDLLPEGIQFIPWNAGAAVINPNDRIVEHDRNSLTNKEFFDCLKPQAWVVGPEPAATVLEVSAIPQRAS